MTLAVAGCAPTTSGPETICDEPKLETCAVNLSVAPEPAREAARFACADEPVDLYAGRGGTISDALFVADDTGIAVANFDVVELWRPGVDEPSATCWGHRGTVLDIDVRGPLLASVAADGTAWLWQASSCSEQLALDRIAGKLSQVVLSSDGRHVAAAGDRHAYLWSVDAPAPISIIEHPGTIVTIAFSRAGAELFTSDREGLVKLTAPGARPTTIIERPDSVAVVPLVIDAEEYLALAGDSVGVWRRGDGRYTEGGPLYAAWSIDPHASPDQRRLLTTNFKAAKLWSLPDARLIATVDGKSFHAAEFSPDGAHFALADRGRLRLYRVADGVELDAVNLPDGFHTKRISFSADSRHVLVALNGYRHGMAYSWCPKLEERAR